MSIMLWGRNSNDPVFQIKNREINQELDRGEAELTDRAWEDPAKGQQDYLGLRQELLELGKWWCKLTPG